MPERPDHVGRPMEDRHAALERSLIAEYLGTVGHTLESVAALPSDQRIALLRSAAAAATLKLSEIESRAKFLEEIHED